MFDFEFNVEKFLSLVEENTVLWDRSLDIYKNKTLTYEAWKEIAAKMKDDFDNLNQKDKDDLIKTVIKKWTNIRDCYLKWYKIYKEQKKRGGPKRPRRKYYYHTQLHFLKKIVDGASVSAQEENVSISEGSDHEHETFIPPSKVKKKPIKSNATTIINETIKEPTSQKPIENAPETSRHLLFFQGILPSILPFDDDQTIEFQMGVLQLIKGIKRVPTTNEQDISFVPIKQFDT